MAPGGRNKFGGGGLFLRGRWGRTAGGVGVARWGAIALEALRVHPAMRGAGMDIRVT